MKHDGAESRDSLHVLHVFDSAGHLKTAQYYRTRTFVAAQDYRRSWPERLSHSLYAGGGPAPDFVV